MHTEIKAATSATAALQPPMLGRRSIPGRHERTADRPVGNPAAPPFEAVTIRQDIPAELDTPGPRWLRNRRYGSEFGDLGAQLVGLMPQIIELAGPRATLEADIAFPRSQVRLAFEAFGDLLLRLIASAVSAGAATIRLRTRKIGTHIWTLIYDDGHELLDPEISGMLQSLMQATHGRMLVRSRAGAGNAIALILPTVLCVDGADRPSSRPIVSKRKETTHEEDGQSVAA